MQSEEKSNSRREVKDGCVKAIRDNRGPKGVAVCYAWKMRGSYLGGGVEEGRRGVGGSRRCGWRKCDMVMLVEGKVDGEMTGKTTEQDFSP